MNGAAAVSGTAVMRDAVLVAILVVPIELVHHLVRLNKLALCLLAVVCALLVIGIVLRVASARKDPSAIHPAAKGREAD